MYGYYSNQDAAPWDAAFKAQIEHLYRSGTYAANVLNAIRNDWETQKFQVINDTKVRYANIGINNETIQNTIHNFIQLKMQTYCSMPPMNYNPMGYNNMGGMMQMYNRMPMGMSPGMMAQPFQTTTLFPQAPAPMPGPQTVSTEQVYAPLPQPQAQPAPTQQSATTVGTQQTTQAPPVAVTNETFVTPKMDVDADQLYGSDKHESGLGNFKVINMIDGDGIKFKHIIIELYDPCETDQEALFRAKKLINFTGNVHVDIHYTKLRKTNISIDVLQRIFKNIKQSINLSTKAKNKLKYIQNIIKILNNESRGVYDAVETLLMTEFNTEAGAGLVNSDYPKDNKFVCNTLQDLWDLTDKETSSPVAKSWQETKNFNERLIEVCDNTIKHLITCSRILDPSDKKDFNLIMRMNVGLIESDDGNLIDIADTILPKATEFIKATPEKRDSDFGEAGKIINHNAVIVTEGAHLIYTTLVPMNTLYKQNNCPVVILDKNYIGGFNDKNEPNSCECTFEYMLTQASLTDIGTATIIINCMGLGIITEYHAVYTTDKWLSLTPNVMQ